MPTDPSGTLSRVADEAARVRKVRICPRVDRAGESQPKFGDRLRDIVGESGWSWLEDAVLAGHMPHLEGTTLALRAARAFVLSEIDDAEAQGVDGDALGWATAFAESFREIIVMLEEHVTELEHRGAEILRREQSSDVPTHIRRANLKAATAADTRGDRARGRLEEAAEDNRRAKESYGSSGSAGESLCQSSLGNIVVGCSGTA